MTPTNYSYNGDGARVKKSYNGVTTYYVGALYEYTTWNGGSSVRKYYYFGGQRIAVKQDINISYIHGDHLGSTNKTTGASSSTQTYYPYGAIKTSSGTPPTDYGFTGQKRDASTNLMYYGARYYDPALARFVQPDTLVPNPMDPQSLNRYSYVRNNPVNRIDPTGHEDCEQQSEDCDTYFHAQGLCWNARREEYSRSCPATVDSEEDLEKIAHEHPDFLTNPNLKLLFGTINDQPTRVGILLKVGWGLAKSQVDELDILRGLTTIAAIMVGNIVDWFVDDLTLAFEGYHSWESITCARAGSCDLPPYIDKTLGLIVREQHVGEKGFAQIFRDPPGPHGNGSQAAHLWEYVALSHVFGYEVAIGGNFVNEKLNPGGSDEDYALGIMGARLGNYLHVGYLKPDEVSYWLYEYLSDDIADPYPH